MGVQPVSILLYQLALAVVLIDAGPPGSGERGGQMRPASRMDGAPSPATG